MKLKHFLSAKAIISLLFGVILVAVPVEFMSVFGVVLDPVGSVMARLLGAMLVAVGLICWAERNKEPNQLKGITFSLFVGDSIGFVILLMAQLTGMFNALGWANVALWLLLASGWDISGLCSRMRVVNRPEPFSMRCRAKYHKEIHHGST